MAYDINASLERLEKNLKNVDSAREQVEKTVAASNALQESVARYVNSLNILEENVRRLIADLGNYKSMKTSELESAVTKLKSSCDVVIATFKTQIESSSSYFEKKMVDTLSLFETENNKLKAQVKDLGELKEALRNATEEVKVIKTKLDEVSNNLQEFQANQDATLTAMQTTINSLPSVVSNIINPVDQKINSISSALSSLVEEMNKQVDPIISTQADIESSCNSIISDIDALKKSIDKAFGEVKNGMNINRWILIAGIILIAVLHFI